MLGVILWNFDSIAWPKKKTCYPRFLYTLIAKI